MTGDFRRFHNAVLNICRHRVEPFEVTRIHLRIWNRLRESYMAQNVFEAKYIQRANGWVERVCNALFDR